MGASIFRVTYVKIFPNKFCITICSVNTAFNARNLCKYHTAVSIIIP